MSAEFCDTNIIVYAYDKSEAAKSRQAAELLDRLWTDHAGVLSVQVLQELYVTLSRRAPESDSRDIIADFASAWPVVEPDGAAVLAAIDASRAWQLSFWDAMILTAAELAGCEVLWTEDLQHGRRYGSVMALTPFREAVAP